MSSYPLGRRGKLIGSPGQGTHSRTNSPDNWQSDEAVDISIPVGTAVVAVTDGTIGSQIGSLGSGGRFAGLRLSLISKANEFYYAHLSRITVKAGQRVKQGDILGYSGSAVGVPHLHFAQRQGDPRQTISGRLEAVAGGPGGGVDVGDALAAVSPVATVVGAAGGAKDAITGGADAAAKALFGVVGGFVGEHAVKAMLYGVLILGGLALVAIGLSRALGLQDRAEQLEKKKTDLAKEGLAAKGGGGAKAGGGVSDLAGATT